MYKILKKRSVDGSLNNYVRKYLIGKIRSLSYFCDDALPLGWNICFL